MEGKQEQSTRQVRSFVRRQGRMTDAQKRALDQSWAEWGIDLPDEEVILADLFSNENPVVLEIGFGMGDTLAAIAEANVPGAFGKYPAPKKVE